MRILVDHDGYDLLNLGGIAMLQSCVVRLRQQWPDAVIKVIAHAPARLQQHCPGTSAIGLAFADAPYLQIFPRQIRLASEQLWRIAGPPLSRHLGRTGRNRTPQGGWPRMPIEAARWADVVVAAGGGYLTDTWWWHAAGVLSLLDFAQGLGKPTAMFGQGIGPLRGRGLRAMACRVLPRLNLLGLREEVTSLGLALSFGTPQEIIWVTGDDAIEVIPRPDTVAGTALGVNIRAADYSGISPDTADAIGESLLAAADDFGAPIIALPVSRYPTTSDLDTIRHCLGGGRPGADAMLADLSSPAELLSAAAQCRAVVTGSYHAAVYSLCQGVPTVCLTRSSYYDAKFAGLSALFPEVCQVISLTHSHSAHALRGALERAWALPSVARRAAIDAAERQRTAGRQAYAAFRLTADGRESPVPVRCGG